MPEATGALATAAVDFGTCVSDFAAGLVCVQPRVGAASIAKPKNTRAERPHALPKLAADILASGIATLKLRGAGRILRRESSAARSLFNNLLFDRRFNLVPQHGRWVRVLAQRAGIAVRQNLNHPIVKIVHWVAQNRLEPAIVFLVSTFDIIPQTMA